MASEEPQVRFLCRLRQAGLTLWSKSRPPLYRTTNFIRRHATVAGFTLLVCIPGAIISFSQLFKSDDLELTASIDDLKACASPCAIAKYLAAESSGQFTLVDVFVLFKTKATLANSTSIPFIVTHVRPISGIPLQGYSDGEYLHAEQFETALAVNRHFRLELGLLTHFDFPVSLRPGEMLTFNFGSQFPAAKSYVAAIAPCLSALIKSGEVEPVTFSSKDAKYRPWYSVVPLECITSTNAVPSGADETARDRYTEYLYEPKHSMRSFLQVDFMDGRFQFIPVGRRALTTHIYGTRSSPSHKAENRAMR